ncbi:MAG: glycosyl transferase group 1 [Mucilaginibacter sp.]|nr:glycosyl transferase group 1 [Mucilaginibacter sp.]
MKIALVSTYDTIGGAARATFRLHSGLLNKNINSQMLVQQKGSDDLNVIGLRSKTEKLWSAIATRLNNIPLAFYPKKENYIFSPSYFGGFNAKKYQDKYDIFNIHWVGGGFQSIDSISNIKKPLVLTLHDSWAFTGGCHIPYPCDKYLTKCGSCIKLNSSHNYDLSTNVWARKQEAWKHKNIVLVGDGTWIADNAKKSSIFNGHRVEVIHPGLDLNVYKPLDKKFCREILGIEQDVKLILFGAVAATADKNKGFQLLMPALKKFAYDNGDNQKVKLIVFGSSTEAQDSFDIDTQYIGKIHDDISLAILYSAADVMIVPSIIESFGQTASESFACGTPVVAFRTSGLKDIVDHKINGFLAEPYDYNDLAAGISWVLADADRLKNLSMEARKKAVKKFDIGKYVDDYINVYESLML